jgi:signal transduction histidine kinase
VRRTFEERRSQARISLSLLVLPVVGVLLLSLMLASLGLVMIWVGIPLLLWTVPVVRSFANHHRRLVGGLTGRPVPDPYLSPPVQATSWQRFALIMKDRATWRDLLWLLVNGTAGLLVGFLPALLLAEAVLLLAVEPLMFGLFDPQGWSTWVGWIEVRNLSTSLQAMPFGLVSLALFWMGTPTILGWYAGLARRFLEPAPGAELKKRVEHLTVSRSDTVGSAAAEMRRIERDLHDGAQARIVSLGMNLGLAQDLMDSDPRTASKLLEEARESSTQALAELRRLVRGIHPPVLADRGLVGGLQALAMACPIPVTSKIEIPGRASDPIEAALYFAVAEVLTNAARHSHARQVGLIAGHTRGRITVEVTDDGDGGAVLTPAGGLGGLRRRLDAFDGTVELNSPVGGPTRVLLEVPCELS